MGVEKYAGLTRKTGGRFVWNGSLTLDTAALDTPLKWRKPRMIFVNSMSDLFHEGVPTNFVKKVWKVMATANQHTYQILTKRPERLKSVVASLPKLPNVWLGTSVESSEYLHRIEVLREVNASIRFVSFEPLLGSVAGANLKNIHWAIVGGESGPRARPMKREWVKEIRSACRMTDTAFFFKQWGGKNKAVTGRKLDGKTWNEFPSPSP
jgi:protein gp37